MRRIAVLVVCIAFALGCTEKWYLTGADGGPDLAAGSGGSGGNGGLDAGAGSGGKGGGAGAGAVTGGRGGSGHPCNDQAPLGFVIQKAQLVFSVGRNVSMATRFGDTIRMSAVQTTLSTLVYANQSAVNFGYQDFPHAPSCVNGTSCCANARPIWPTPQAFGAIDMAMRMCEGQPAGPPTMSGCVSGSESRPIADAFRGAINPGPPRIPIFDLNDMRVRDRYFVLMVDGAPACSAEDPLQSCSDARNQLSQLLRANINVYVVPVGEDAEMADCLRMLAVAANSGTAGVPFAYLARDPSQLMQSMSQIVDKAASASCVINLLDIPADNSRVELWISNKPIPRDTQNGWTFIPGSTSKIEVRGTSCRELQKVQNPRDIEILPGCPS